MRCVWKWSAAAFLAAACALPGVEVDPSLTPGAGGTSGGSGGKGGTNGKGGTGLATGNAGAAAGDEREVACGDYCTPYLANCGDFEANTYDDLADCLTTCFTSNWPLGSDTDEPNSIQCRVLHANLAATGQDPHCFHSAEVPSKTICALPSK